MKQKWRRVHKFETTPLLREGVLVLKELDKVNARILGMVLNKVNSCLEAGKRAFL